MLQSLIETITALMPVVFPLVFLSQLLLGALGALIKLINRPRIDLYPAGEIAIGFDQLGPSTTLFGTMQAQRGDFFITKIEAVFRQPATNFVRTLEWRAFRPYLFGLRADEDIKYELVAAFALKASAPFKYNIVFIDDVFINQELEQVRIVLDAWQEFQSKTSPELSGTAQVEAFYNQPTIQAIAQLWQERMYWRAGAYQLEIVIHSNQRKLTFPYAFTLTENDTALLRNNTKAMIRHICGERGAFGKAFAAYGPKR